MTKIQNEMVDAAISWYVSLIRDPQYGDRANGQLEGFASILATFIKMKANDSAVVTDEQIEIFSNAMREGAEKYAENKQRMTLDVDWAPEWPLSDFLQKAKIPGTFFPCKTMVWLDFGKQTVTTDWSGGKTLYDAKKSVS